MDEVTFLFLAFGLLMTLWSWKASGKGSGHPVSRPFWYRAIRLLCLTVIFLPCLLLTVMDPVPERVLDYAVDGEILAFVVLVFLPSKVGQKGTVPLLTEEEKKGRRRNERQKALFLGAAVTVLMWIAFLYLI